MKPNPSVRPNPNEEQINKPSLEPKSNVEQTNKPIEK